MFVLIGNLIGFMILYWIFQKGYQFVYNKGKADASRGYQYQQTHYAAAGPQPGPQPQSNKGGHSNIQVVTINGQRYLIADGQAYPIIED